MKKIISLIIISLLIAILFFRFNTSELEQDSNVYTSSTTPSALSNQAASSKKLSTDLTSSEKSKSSQIESDLKVRRRIAIDPVAFREALLILDLPSGTNTRDTKKEAQAMTVLADLYPEELLIQFFAATRCTTEKFTFCNTETYIDRIRTLDPNNILADKLVFKFHLDDKDLISALSVLENISNDAFIDMYFPDTTNEIYRQLTSGQWVPDGTPDKIPKQDYRKLVMAVGISAMNVPLSTITRTCVEQTKTSSQKERWLTACKNYSKVLNSSSSFMEKNLGSSLQKKYLESINSPIELELIEKEERKIYKLMTGFGQECEFDFETQPESIKLWLEDLKKYGEIVAAQKCIERTKN